MFVRARVDFASEDPHALPFTAGDIIGVTNTDGQWWEGWILTDHGHSSLLAPRGRFPANYVEDVELDAKTPLRLILDIRSAVREFTRFCESEYSSENVRFWLAVQAFRALPVNRVPTEDKATILRAAQELYNVSITETYI
jgi:hypothetical protein